MDELSNKCFNYKPFYIMSKIIASSVEIGFPLEFSKANAFALVCLLFSFPCHRVGGRWQSDQGQGLLEENLRQNMLGYDMEGRAKSHLQTQLLT